MKFFSPGRCFALTAALSCAAAGLCVSALAQERPRRTAPPPVQRPAPQSHPQQPATSTLAPIQRHENPGRTPNGEHLAGWLDHHSNLTPSQQQQALEREPGFHDLPPQTQQRMRDRLTQINGMTPDQRSRLLSRTEAMEHMTPEQRGQVRTAMQQLASLPPASHRAVARTFRNLRDMAPAQREAYLNSPDVRSQFTEQERSTLFNLMAVEPYLPPRNPNEP